MESIITSSFRDFVRINPLIFLGIKVGEVPKEFVHRVYKVLVYMGETYGEKEELSSYQLREISQVWYTQREDTRSVESGPIE